MSTPPHSLPVAGTVVLLRAADPGFEVLLMRRPDRGSFAGAWVFPGGKVEPADRRGGGEEVEDARRAAIRETYEEVGVVVEELVAFSEWHPPVEVPTRIHTWFFLAAAPTADPSPSEEEVAELAWVRPAEALARHGAAEWMLYPPTWMTLHQLSAFTDAASALSSGDAVQLIRTRVVGSGAAQAFAWEQGRLEAAELPWRFLPA